MQIKSLLLAVLCCFSFQAISQTLCVDTGAPVGGSGGIASTDFAQSITMSGCTGTFAGLVVDGGTVVSDGNPVWNLDIFQGDGFGGTLQYSQTGIVLTNVGGGHIFINIAGGSGSRTFTSGNQYTFRVSTASSTNSVTVFRNNTSFYAGGQGYIAGATFGTGGDILNVSIYTQATNSSCGAATRLYVKHNASGTNNGTSWTNAYTSLQSAIDYARGCSNIQEIWVSSGTYKPSKDKTGNASPGSVAAKTFYINFPLALYGGFAGTETLLSQRNLASNVTILSGDLDNNDTANPAVTAADVQGTNANIVLHIQDVAAGCTADGFTITAGQFASGFSGGGLHNEGTGFPFGCSATIRNCKIQGNAGPAVFNSGNFGSSSSGKAILLLENSTISGNSEEFYAAGIYSNSNGGRTSTTVNNCTFSNNTSTGTSNSGAYNEAAPSGNGEATFSNCIFRDNNATSNGAAVHANGSSSGFINHSFTNCIFMNNTSGNKGGAYYANGAPSGRITSTFTNCTFYNNAATNGGSAVYHTTSVAPTSPMLLRNCILWQNTNEILLEGMATMTLSYSLINGVSAPAGVTADNSLFNTDPIFVNAAGGDLQLQNISPAVNTGTNTGAPANDLYGNARPFGSTVDMGVHELQSASACNSAPSITCPSNQTATLNGGGTFTLPDYTSLATASGVCTPISVTQSPVAGTVLSAGVHTITITATASNNLMATCTFTVTACPVWYKDTDNDAYAQTGAGTITNCTRPTGYKLATELLATSGDCNDNNAAIYPGATEICDGIDNNCDGTIDGPSVCPNYTITTTAGAIVITDAAGNGETLNVSQNGANIRFDVTGRTYSLNGGATLNFPADVALSGASSIAINTAVGNDIINVSAFSANLPSLTINGGTGDDQVRMNGDITFAANANLDVDMQNDDATPGTDQVSFTNNAHLVLSGTGAAVIKVSRNINFSNGTASLETVNGNLTLEANQQATASTGNFSGISMFGATVRVNGTGTLTVKGKSGNDSVINQYGVLVQNGGLISGGTSATATIQGSVGAASADANVGVYVTGTNARITSLGGNVSVVGLGGSTGASSTCMGVSVTTNASITAGGSGTVTVNGTGGAGTGNFNAGVYVAGSTSTFITSSGGNVSVTGVGGGTGSGIHNYGIWMELGGTITAGGSGSITVQGTGGTTTGNNNYGILIDDANTQITSGGGNVSVTGQGGGSGGSTLNIGVFVQNAAKITATGTGAVSVSGTGGNTTGGNNHGVYVTTNNAQITSSGGNVSVSGQGGGTSAGDNNIGVFVLASGLISSGGSGVVTVNGTGASTSGNSNYGVYVFNTNSRIGSTNANINITAQGGGLGTSVANQGLAMVDAAQVVAGGSGNVTIQANGGAATGGGSNVGLYMQNLGTLISSSGGNVTINAVGGGIGTGSNNYGVNMITNAQVSAGGSGTVSVSGQGGGGAGSSNIGVRMLNPGTQITSSGGNITVTGIEGSGSSGIGISHTLSAELTTATNGGNITLIANSMGLASTVSTQNTGTTTLRPYTNNVQIDLGTTTNTVGGPLGLSDTELDNITTGNITIGNANSGNITVSADIIRPASTNVQLVSGGDVLISGGGFNTGGGTLLLDPGTSPAAVKPIFNGTDVTASTLSFASDLSIAINGTSAGDGTGSSYSQLNVVGAVNLTGVDLLFTGSYVPSGGETFTIVENDGSDPIVGTFTGLAQGATIANFRGSGLNATISYTGGSGNDVVITVITPAAPEINTKGNGLSILDGDTSPNVADLTDFGNIDIYSTDPVVHTFTIQNTGTANLVIPAGGITKSGDGDFGIGTVFLPFTIAPGDSVTFPVIIDASGNGPRTATISILSNDTDESPYTFNVSAVGVSPEINVTGLGQNITSGDITPSPLDDTDFGSFDVSAGTLSHTFTIQNTGGTGGDLYLNAGSITIFGTHASDFSISGITLPDTISPGQSTTFVVNFNPSALGTRNATIRIANNDLGESQYRFDVQGIGITPDYTITTTGNVLTITDIAGNSEILDITQSSTNIRFNATGRSYSINGAPATLFTTPADVALAGITSIVVNAATGNDIINIGAFTANLPDLTINGGVGDDLVNFNGGINFASNANLDVDLQNDDATPGADAFVVLNNANLLLFGTGTATVKVSKSLSINGNSSIETQNGNLTLEANQQTTSITGLFIGIRLLSGGVVRSVNGNLKLAGKGGTANDQYGIYNLGTITTTGSGNILLQGTGSPSGEDNDGVRNVGTISATGSGDIQITGIAPTTTGSEAFANQSGAAVTTTSGDITIDGDIVYLDPTSSVSAGSNKVTIAPTTGGRIIDLGTDDTATQLGLTDEELDRITAGTLVIGSATSGAITVSQPITRSASTNVQLISNGDVLISGGGFNTAGGTLLLDPGTSPAAVKPSFNGTDVTASTLSFASDLQITINGTTLGNGVGSTYTQLKVAGTVNLTGVDLLFAGTYIPVGANIFTIVDNDGTDAIIGTFTGLAEGAIINNFRGSGLNAAIFYTGGSDNNDVVLTVINNILCYADTDGDGYGDPSNSMTFSGGCGTGFVSNNTDCDDNDVLEKPGQIWYVDVDGDGYSQGTFAIQCLRPTGYKAASELIATSGDCNDNLGSINPGATEICDGIDNNCNGSTDEGGLTTYYRDQDGDSFGNPAVSQEACSQPSGYVTNNTDCDDNDALEKPGQVWYADVDNDGYSSGTTLTQCLRPVGYKVASELTATSGDCNDNNFAIKPSATEICDGIDNNCNGSTDEGVTTTYYADSDNDGFGDPAVSQQACSQPSGYVTNNTDCDDNDALEKPGQIWYADVDNDGYSSGTTLTQCLRPVGYKVAAELTATTGDCNDNNFAIKPSATEICDGIDNNCNGTTDEGGLTTYYRDQDGDSFGNPAVSQEACSQPSGYVTNNTDCDDNDVLEKPGQVWYADVDNDGYSDGTTLTQCLRPVGYKVAAELTATSGDCNDNNAAINPAATEICDGIDNNCDGTIDGSSACPDYIITTTAGAIVITDVAGNGETLTVTQNGANIRFNATGRTYSLNGGLTFNLPADVALAGASSITVNTAVGNDNISIGAFTANLPSLTVNGGVGDDAVNFNGDITFASNANLDVDLQNDDATPGVDAFAVANNVNLLLSGTGTATVKVSKSLFINSNASIETENGNLTLEANQQTTSSTGLFIGITLLNGAIVRSINGTVALTGRGGTDSNGIQHGIENMGTIATTGTGNLLLEGTGGLTGTDNDGVRNGGSISATGSGDIQITGFSPTSAASEALANQPGGAITTTAGDITIDGDIVYLDPASSISAGTNKVTIAPITNSRIINLGSEDTPTRLGLTDAELDRITAGTLIIGSASSGAIMVSVGITRPAATNLQLISNSDVAIQGGGINAAGGTVLLDPGASPAAVKPTFTGTDVTASTLSFGSDLAIVINGITPGSGYNQLSVSGEVNLSGVELILSGTHSPANGQSFIIVNNDGSADAIMGTFTGLAQGAILSNFLGSNFNATISYTGGDGNDVVLTMIDNVVCYADTDNDGYGDPNNSMTFSGSCGTGFVSNNTDCNDNSAAINPDATEICDGIDNNCNGTTDEGVTTTYYADVDNDGFGDPAVSQQACSQPSGYVTNNTDCDDNDVLEKPGQIWYADVDNDGYSSGTTLTQCLRPVGYKVASELTATSGDCNDNDPAINPTATEVCDGVDNNCDGVTDEGCTPPMVSIHDPCTCMNNSPLIENGTTTDLGTFSETVTVEGPSGQTWTIVSVTGLYSDVNATVAYTTGATIPETGVGTGVFDLLGYHRDGAGYTISVTNGRGDTLEIGNTCYYPDPVFTGLPALVSPNAAPFTVTGTVANNAAGTGTFILDGNTQVGAGAAPTQLTINPATLSVGTHTLVYSFDAGTPGSQNPADPGCVQQVQQRFRVANCACQDVTVSLDENCQFLLTGNLVSDVNCGGGTVRVMDNDPSNGGLIDCAGVWTYGLFDTFGNIICWGKVTAEDKTAPILVCAPDDFILDCYDVNYVLNNRLTIGNLKATSSPRPAATSSQTINNAEGIAGTGDACQLGLIPPSLVNDNIQNLGYAYFKDNCYNCGCRVTLKWTDKVEFYSCEDMKVNGGIYAKIAREWTATDCNGMRSSYVQSIKFTRPAVDDFVFNGPGEGKYDRVVEYNSCTPDKSLIKKEDVTPYVCSYFNSSNNPRCLFIDQVECNYSVQIKDTEFPICGGKGVKIDRELYVFDWCAGGIVDTFHILIKIGDFTAPTVEYAHGAPYDISTGPMDCTAAIPVTVAGIKTAFGVTIKDNCNLGNISTSVYTKDRYVKGILVYEGPEDPICIEADRKQAGELRGDNETYRLGDCTKEDDICWDKVEYAVMNGMMIGLPVGKHLMVIEAFDGCYNASTTCFVFEVKDKIAPVMKCDDDLHVTLSNANGYTSGYAQVSAEDIDEGSWDNCKLAWIAVRRNVPDGCAASFIQKGYDTNGNGKLDALPADGDVSKADGFDLNGDGDIADFGETFILKGGKLMTPLLDFVEFFCCDLTERVTVELWGGDIYGNTNYCWMDLLIEDKVAPTCIAPWAITVDCDDKGLAQIDDKVASAKIFGDVTITTGSDCAALDTVYSTVKKLKCGYGYIDRIWTLTKQTVKGPISITCTQRIWVNPVHEYNICFPKDVSTDCKTPIIDTVITDELGCDILAVNVHDKRYDASDDECYKIFRTYSVINWCTYDDRCGDPLLQTNISIIDRAVFGNYGKAPVYVLVRDRERGVRDGVEEFYISKDLIHNNADDIRIYPPYCEVAGEFYHSFIYTQIIKVYDDTRPVVTGVRDTFCTSPTACTANITKVVTLKDNCTDKVELETQFLMIAPFQTLEAGQMILYSTPRWSTKDLGNGQFEIKVSNLPEGTHDLIVVGRDECGNLSLPTRIPFVVKDCKAPAPICINGLSTGIMPDGNGGGMMAVWATDFVASKIYDCNGQGAETKDGLKLVTKYSINRVGSPVNKDQTGLNFTCTDINNSPILVELHAWDNAGNHDFCITFVELIDSRGVCPGSATGVSVAGTISTEGNANLQGASITLSGTTSQNATTAANGGYSFINLSKGGDFTVTPQLDKNHLNGVSTFDLVLIQKHILGVQALNSPYKMIAADANNSKSISTLDLIALRKLILNIDTHFANNTSWRFVDATYVFPNPGNPWSAAFPEVVSINDIANNVTANFVAIKVGDVNASASVNSAASAEVRTKANFKLKTLEQNLKSGNEYKVSFTAEDLKNIQGYQFALNLDQSKVELVDIEYGVAKAENFGVFKNEGLITTSWNSKYEPGALFTLVLRAKADAKLSSTLSLNRLLSPEAYDQNNENLGIALNFEGIQAAEAYELRQNTPNPFSDETVIGFMLPKATKGTLTVRDVKGATIYKVEGNYSKGNNQVTLKKEQLGASGVLYYTLETTEFTATKKMVILE